MATAAGPAAEVPVAKVHLGMELDADGVPVHSPMETRNNPCKQAKEASFKCLLDNNYENSKCTDVFVAYRECKKYWGEQKKYYRQAMYARDRKEMKLW